MTRLYVKVAVAACACLVYHYFNADLEETKPPELKDEYFGKKLLWSNEKIPKDDPTIRKFTVNIEEAVLLDLKTRLNNTRYVDSFVVMEFQYGLHPNYLRKLVDYWINVFDWRLHEKKLNEFDQFVTQIEGIDVHFIHQKPKTQGRKTKVVPLLLIHGWPSSIAEFMKIIPLLTTPREDVDFVFEVICPSIPGYGFSEAPHQSGFSVSDATRFFRKLMDRLRINKFYVHGGDWGIAIATSMAKYYPLRVSGIHVNMVTLKLGMSEWLKYFSGYVFSTWIMSEKEYERLYPLSKVIAYLFEETGYMHLQATKPETIGSALIDSPAGLAAYILEKFSTWTNRNYIERSWGGLNLKFTMDELLTNVMIYWCTNSIASSMRLYREELNGEDTSSIDSIPVRVPTAIASFPNEYMALPPSLLEPHFQNVVRFTRMLRGGHFGALEEPQLLSDDIFAFVKDVERASQKNRHSNDSS